MATPVLKLTKGTRALDLRSGRYRVAASWAPPAIAEVPLLAEGTSANRGGAALVSRRPVNRSVAVGVAVVGTSAAEIQRGLADLQTFLSLAGDEAEPLYLEFLPDGAAPEPLWGNYGVNLRYEVVHGTVAVADSYGRGQRLAGNVDATLTLQLKPYAVGRPQRLASALGGIIEDTLGAADGISRGLIIPAATPTGGNKFTNPVFGHSTWNTGWTAAANIVAAQNTDSRFVFPGAVSSAFLIATTGASNTFYQTFNVGNTNTHHMLAYVIKPDLSAVSASDVGLMFNNALQTTTYTSVGNGVYLLTASFAGVNAAALNGVIVASGASVYLLAIQIVEASVFHPLTTGDMLGCAWAGTAHNSASTRTGSSVRIAIADALKRGQGAIAVVWKADRAHTAYATHGRLFDFDTNNFYGRWNQTSNVWQFNDGTNSITSSATTLVAGTVYVLHFVFGPSGLVVYLNGVSIASGGSFKPQTAGTYLHIGNGGAGTESAFGTFLDFRTFGMQLTAAQVAADYANIAPLAAAGQRVGTIPWLWTKDGDDVVDNCDDSSRDNWAAAGGIPGGADAETVVSLTNTNSNGIVYLVRGGLPYALFAYPTAPLYWAEHSGTVDGNSSGGQYNAIASLDNASVTAGDYRQFLGQQLNFFTRGRPVGDTSLTGGILVGSAILGYANLKPASSANYNLYYLGSVVVGPQTILGIDILAPTVTLRLQNTGNTYNSDFLLAAIGDVTRVDAGGSDFVLRGNRAKVSSAGALGADLPVLGKAIALQPDRLNMIWALMAAAVNGAMTITHTATFASIKVRPVYPLL